MNTRLRLNNGVSELPSHNYKPSAKPMHLSLPIISNMCRLRLATLRAGKLVVLDLLPFSLADGGSMRVTEEEVNLFE